MTSTTNGLLMPEDLLGTLTTVPEKAEEFRLESYVRESWRDAELVLGDDRTEIAHRVAFITLKPEAIVGRRGPACIEYLEDHGFSVVGHRCVRYDRNSIQAIWRFQWNVASLDRLALADELYCATDCVLVALTHQDRSMPATVPLRQLKGPAQPELRAAGTLRSALDAPTRILTFVHAADEPIDVVREIGVLFPRAERQRFYAELRDGLVAAPDGRGRDHLLAALAELHTEVPSHSLRLEDACRGLDRRLAKLAGDTSADTARVARARQIVAGAAGGVDYVELGDLVNSVGISPDDWDLMVIGSHAIKHDVPGAVCTIDEDGVDGWLEIARGVSAR